MHKAHMHACTQQTFSCLTHAHKLHTHQLTCASMLRASEAHAYMQEFDEKLDKFGRLLVVRSLRDDRTILAANEYIADTLGQKYIESTPLNLETTWAESNERCPLICLLSPGSDPTDLIEKLAKKMKKSCNSVSMGQGQEIIAARYIAAAILPGAQAWVLLQNTHLGLKYMGTLEQYLLKTEEIDADFRLWITAEPNKAFPLGLLQMSIKITNEAPVGMKAGLKRSYAWITQDMLDTVNRIEWRSLLYVQCFLHSVTQERRKFGPIGWCIPYEFNQGDLSASVQFIQNHILEMDAKKAKEVTWSTVRYMVSEIQYGGRITDDWDRVLMSTYTEKYFFQVCYSQKASCSCRGAKMRHTRNRRVSESACVVQYCPE